MKRLVMTVAAMSAALVAAGAVEWKNVDEEHYLGGRKASAGYLQGKVVLVDRWGAKCPPCRALLPTVEKKIWQSFKTKSFVVLGGHCGGWGSAEAVKGLIEENSITYPVYEDAGLANGEPAYDAIPFLYLVDETGKVVYKGRDENTCIQAVVTALTDMDAPKNLADWKRFLDFELENLPGKAYLRMGEFKKKFPKEAKDYAEKFKALAAVPDVKKLSELVAFAKRAKDAPVFSPKKKQQQTKYQKSVKDALTKFASLKESKDPRVVQEAKNALADLKWTAATF